MLVSSAQILSPYPLEKLGTIEPTMPSEPKPSWSVGYVSLQILLLSFAAVIGFGVNHYFRKSELERRTLLYECAAVFNRVLKPRTAFSDSRELVADYYLRSDPSKKLEAYFPYRCAVWNDGEIGVEEFDLHFLAPEGISLSSDADIVAVPAVLSEVRRFRHIETEKENSDRWRVDLLNPGERLVFLYVGYSTERPKTTDLVGRTQLSVSLHKKDWQLLSHGESTPTSEFQRRLLIPVVVAIALFMGLATAVIFFILPYTNRRRRS